MKRSLILLSLLAGPCLFCSYKAEADTLTTAETRAEATGKKPVPAHIYNHFKEYSFFFTYKESDALCAGYEGNTAVLDKLTNRTYISYFCAGAAAAGHTELVLQCLGKGADPDYGLRGAAAAGHLHIVSLLLDHGANDYNDGMIVAAEAGHFPIVHLLLDKGGDPKFGFESAAKGGHTDIVKFMYDQGACQYDAEDGVRKDGIPFAIQPLDTARQNQHADACSQCQGNEH